MIGLIADDLTGACDSAVSFLGGGRVEVGIWPRIPAGDLACCAVSTESRGDEPEAGFERSRLAADALRRSDVSWIYVKVDSMLRGNVAAQLEGVVIDHDGPCLFAPALPQEGRVTTACTQTWGDQAIDLVNLLASRSRPVRCGGPEWYARTGITVCDARSDKDLAEIARVVLSDASILAAGSAGLARQLGKRLSQAPIQAQAWPPCRHPVAVVGSEVAGSQASAAGEGGWPVISMPYGSKTPLLSAYDGLFVTGGSTAFRVLSDIGACGIELIGEISPLVPIGLILGGEWDGRPVVTKSGSFGTVDAISVGLERLCAGG